MSTNVVLVKFFSSFLASLFPMPALLFKGSGFWEISKTRSSCTKQGFASERRPLGATRRSLCLGLRRDREVSHSPPKYWSFSLEKRRRERLQTVELHGFSMRIKKVSNKEKKDRVPHLMLQKVGSIIDQLSQDLFFSPSVHLLNRLSLSGHGSAGADPGQLSQDYRIYDFIIAIMSHV